MTELGCAEGRELIQMKKRLIVLSMFLLACFALTRVSPAQGAVKDGHWVSVWGAPEYAPIKFIPIPPESAFLDKTIRMVVRTSIGGDRLRIRLSNALGTSALVIGAVHVALTDEGSKILPGSDRVLTFGGRPKVDIPAGQHSCDRVAQGSTAGLVYFRARRFNVEEGVTGFGSKGRLVFHRGR